MGFRVTSTTFGVPKPTLRRKLNQKTLGSNKVLGRFRATFSDDQKKELVPHIIDLEQKFFGVFKKDLPSLAFQLAEKK